jgi:ATP-binding cassette subfamily F protein uup
MKVGLVPQVPRFRAGITIREAVLEGAALRHPGEEEWHAGLAADEVIARLSLASAGRSAETRVEELSGGWRKRVALARELVRAPDLLLLDEPTNHLDVEAILWLEEFLSRAPFATVTVTHDRLFLQRVAGRVLELDRRNPGGILDVRGGYGRYLEVKEERLVAEGRRESALRNRLRRETEWMKRGAKARSTKQQARVQRAASLGEEAAEAAERGRSRSVRLDFQASSRSPKRLVEAKGISKSLGGKLLFAGLDLLVTPSSRIGLLGPNGCGKTTLLRVLLGAESPDSGEVLRADSLSPVVFEQGRESLDPESTVMETLAPEGDQVFFRGAYVHVRSWLDRFLFREEQAGMRVGSLSGGEQSRLLLARLMLRETNLLVLDEPTNDLDLETLSVLEECLEDFPGAVLLVTHDRWFLDRVTETLLAFGATGGEQEGVVTRLAGLDQWEAWRGGGGAAGGEGSPRAKAAPGAAPAPAPAPARAKPPLGYLERRELDGMEARILAVEGEREALLAETERPENRSDAARLVELLRAIDEKQAEVDRLYARWSDLEGPGES